MKFVQFVAKNSDTLPPISAEDDLRFGQVVDGDARQGVPLEFRIEGDEGVMGFFDEGVVVGKCSNCGRNRVFVHTD